MHARRLRTHAIRYIYIYIYYSVAYILTQFTRNERDNASYSLILLLFSCLHLDYWPFNSLLARLRYFIYLFSCQ